MPIDDPILHYTFDNKYIIGSGIIDTSGHNCSGFVAQTPITINGPVNQALRFAKNQLENDSRYVVNVTDPTNILDVGRSTGQFTLFAWLYPTFDLESSPGPGGLIVQDVAVDGSQYLLCFGFNFPANYITAGFVDEHTDAGGFSIGFEAGCPVSGWSYAAATFDGTTLSLYCNGQSTSAIPGYYASGVPGGTYIGRMVNTNTSFMGYIDDARIYNRALSALEIQSLVDLSTLDNPLLYYTCDTKDKTGATIKDRGQGGLDGKNDGTLINSPPQIKGRVLQGVNLDGTDQYITTNHASGLLRNYADFYNGFSVASWVNPSGFDGTNRTIISAGSNGSGDGLWRLFTGASGNTTGKVTFETFNGIDHSGVTSSGTIPSNQWSHIVGVYQMSGWKVYINGKLNNFSVGEEPDRTSIVPLVVGAFDSSGVISNYWAGGLDEVRIYGRALSDDFIYNLYNFNDSELTSSYLMFA